MKVWISISTSPPEDLATYMDGGAIQPQWTRIVNHLAACDACFGELVAILRLMKNQAADLSGPP